MHGDAGAGSGSAPPPPAPPSAGKVEVGLPLDYPAWSEDGRYVVFGVHARDYQQTARGDVRVVIDAHTHAMFVVDHIQQNRFELAPDHAHAVALRDNHVTVYDLASGTVVGPLAPTASSFRFVRDGRIAWAERAGDTYKLHLRVPGGADTVLTGLPAHDEGVPVAIQEDEAGRVIASTPEALRVWEHDAPAPVVTLDARFPYDPLVSSDGIAYAEAIDDDHQRFRHIDLAAGQHAPAALVHDARCGDGDMDRFEQVDRCAEHRYLVRTKHDDCIWDTKAGRVQARIHTADEESHCDGDLVWTGNLPPGGPYTYYALATGRRVKPPAVDRGYEDDDPAPPPPGSRVTGDLADKLGVTGWAIASPKGDLIAGVRDERATLWTGKGELLWQSPRPSNVGAIAFAPDGTLVAVGRAGDVWHLDLATHRLTSGRIANCTATEADPIGVTSDGHIVATCQTGMSRRLALEGEDKPLASADDYGWYVSVAQTAKQLTIGWLTGGGIVAVQLPAGTTPFHADPAHYGLAFTADATRYATSAPEDPKDMRPSTFIVSISDAQNKLIASAKVDATPEHLAFSADGKYLAVSRERASIVILDAATGATVDEIASDVNTDWPRAPLLAWDPTGAPRVATFRASPARVVIHDVTAKKDVETRLIPRGSGDWIRGIAWSLDGKRLALLAEQVITLWNGAGPPSTIALAGAGGVVLRPDDTAALLGDAATARSLIACTRGPLTSMSLDGCAITSRPR